ncbi:ComEA family DNA-binding protein [candidate division KSB1 bacterium]
MFGFTKREKTIIIILIITFTIGTGIIHLRKISNKNAGDEFKARYSELDNKFSEISISDSLLDIEKKKVSVSKTDLRININTADKVALMKLPGIGTELSDRIINYRTDKGKFKRINEITKIRGIGGGKFEKILPFICIE